MRAYRTFHSIRRRLAQKFFLCFLLASLGGGLSFAVADDAPATAPALRSFTEKNLLELLTATLQRDCVKDRGELELQLTQPWNAPKVPDEELTLKVLEMPSTGVTPSFIIRFQLCDATKTLGTWQTTVRARIWRQVWVANTDLARGASATQADLTQERRDVLAVREPLADFSPNDNASEMAQSVPAGNILLARMLRPRTLIHRSQVTNALVENGGLSISTKVEALEDGAAGQIIHVRNVSSRRDLTGKVLNEQTVLIFL